MVTRSGIPLDTLPTAPTLRDAAQRVVDETTVQDSVHGGSVGIVPYGAIEDLENCLGVTPEPALSDTDRTAVATVLIYLDRAVGYTSGLWDDEDIEDMADARATVRRLIGGTE